MSEFNPDRYRNVRVEGAIADIVFRSIAMPEDEARKVWDSEETIPLDIVPDSYWHNPDGSLRFSDEALGSDF